MKFKNLYSLICFKRKHISLSLLLMLSSMLSYSQATLSVRVNSDNDDMEEYTNAATLNGVVAGEMDAGSSDLELGLEDPNENAQLIGMRFNNITIPQGAVITNAYIQFTGDNTKNQDPSNLTIVGEATDNAVTFNPASAFNLSSRPKTSASVAWNIPAGAWAAGQAGAAQQTSNISSVIQEIIDRAGWVSGNSLALYVSGTGVKEAESADGNNPGAPLLVVEYYVNASLSVRINAADDDMEEYLSTATLNGVVAGEMDAGSSDLELGHEDAGENAQLVGMRFNNITIPQGAQITNAYIQFTVDGNKMADPCNLTIKGEAADNAVTFNPLSPFNLSSRPKTTASANWTIPTGTWTAAGQATADQRTSDIKDIIQEIINRGGWVSGNSLALYIDGTGVREAESGDGNNPAAPLLVIEYLGMPGNPTSSFPIIKGDSWSYLDNGSDQGTTWKNTSFADDDTWAFGSAKFGYGETGLTTTISYGADATNKHITTYFYKRFNVSSVAALNTTLDLSISVDDGAIVYINGTEVVRRNMPAGTVTSTTLASSEITGTTETVYFLYEINKSILVDGENVIAVEAHQASASSDDVRFDLDLKQSTGDVANLPALGCTEDADHISCFTSLLPTSQGELMTIPSSHSYQVIFQNGDTYTKGGGTALGNFDFTGFVPQNNTSSVKGHLSINHETNPGGVSMLDIHFDPSTERWILDSSQAISFTASSIVKTERNCSGGVTPWETVITSEETTASGDNNGDGYQDVGWNVEIDPAKNKIKDYGTGSQQKLWAMGRMSHENVVVKNDSMTVYYGDDTGSGNIFKFVANEKMDLSSGTLYVLKLASGLVSNEPSASTGTWEVVPNSTPTECNTTKALASGLGATTFSGVEDVEISPVDDKIYFTAKGNSRTFRFTDNGSTVSDFETFVGGKSYKINFGSGVVNEDWGTGNDNLTFDDHGNLWVLQDGGRNHVWLVRPDHTQAAPKVELFMLTPAGSEPTGMTFTPDYKFMFISIQSPSGSNTQTQNDVTGTSYTMNKDATVIIARNDAFDGILSPTTEAVAVNKFSLSTYPNPSKGDFNVSFKLDKGAVVEAKLIDLSGKEITTLHNGMLNAGEHVLNLSSEAKGTYILQLIVNGEVSAKQLILY